MSAGRKLEPFEDDVLQGLSKLFEVEGYGMVRVDPAPGDVYQLWLPFQPITVQMRVM